MPAGPCAVLQVNSEPPGRPRITGSTWGSVGRTNVPAQFAELLAWAAARHGGVDVVSAPLVRDRLEAAGLDADYRCDGAELHRRARALGLASYITADLLKWGYGYAWFYSWADLECCVSCYRVGDDRLLWQARIRRRQRNVDYRTVALAALQEAFRRLKAQEQPSGGKLNGNTTG